MSIQQEVTRTGRVKWFDTKKGYGFLNDINSDEDVFIHFSSIHTENEIYKTLYQGEYVSFTSKKDNRERLVTDSVTGVSGGKLLCENDYFLKLHSNKPRINPRDSYNDRESGYSDCENKQ
jgi:CspA family cold shock protein